jgi:hypothetical protein
MSRAPCMRSNVVIRFRVGYATGKAGDSRLGSGSGWAMFRSIFRVTSMIVSRALTENENRFHYWRYQSIKELPAFVNPFFA